MNNNTSTDLRLFLLVNCYLNDLAFNDSIFDNVKIVTNYIKIDNNKRKAVVC